MSFEEISKFRKFDITELEKHSDYVNVQIRLDRLKERQVDTTMLLNRLLALMDNIIGEDESASPKEAGASMSNPYFAETNCPIVSSSSSGISSSNLSSSLSPPSAMEQRFSRTTPPSAKRKIFYDDYQEFSTEDDDSTSQQDSASSQYPQQVGDFVVLGPNGTQIDVRSYNSIIWTSSASATRQLLGFVFTNDILATHTLTGKPSPAFYGRERPAKMQLDPVKAADIIHCVRSKFHCSEREIRAAITTKCSDTSKKYKRRSQKQIESNN